MQFKKLEFKNKDDQTLSARLDLPVDGKPMAYALFAHCFTCSKNIKAIAHISRALTRAGLAVLRLDFTGLGESEGDFADTNFSSNVDDLIVAADFLESNYEAPQILIGHSFGGAAVLQAAWAAGAAGTGPSVGVVGRSSSPCQARSPSRGSQRAAPGSCGARPLCHPRARSVNILDSHKNL